MADFRSTSRNLTPSNPNPAASNLPRTPSPFLDSEMAGPRSPPRDLSPTLQRDAMPKYKIKRRRNVRSSLPADHTIPHSPILLSYDGAQEVLSEADVPLPTIEVSKPCPSLGPATVVPARMPYSPPHTPLDQMMPSEEERIEFSRAWEFDVEDQQREVKKTHHKTVTNSRPSTADSGLTAETRPSTGISAVTHETALTSPELVPVQVPEIKSASPLPVIGASHHSAPCSALSSPFQLKRLAPPAQRTRSSLNPVWSSNMDEHLWATYARYLEDATHTPFKMLPGTTPPTGVADRVCRAARKTWPNYKASRAKQIRDSGLNPPFFFMRNQTPQQSARGHLLPWPATDAPVRKRLHRLCTEREQGLSRHYARLQFRTPSPFSSSSRGSSPVSPPPAPKRGGASDIVSPPSDSPGATNGLGDMNSSFSTRDLNISLATSTSATMQPGGFFSQLAESNPATPQPPRRHSDDITTPLKSSVQVSPPTVVTNKRPNPFAEDTVPVAGSASEIPVPASRPVSRPAMSLHQKSQSLHHNFFGRGFGEHAVLASPFVPRPPVTQKAETLREPAKPNPLMPAIEFESRSTKRQRKGLKHARPQLSLDFGHGGRSLSDNSSPAVSHRSMVGDPSFGEGVAQLRAAYESTRAEAPAPVAGGLAPTRPPRIMRSRGFTVQVMQGSRHTQIPSHHQGLLRLFQQPLAAPVAASPFDSDVNTNNLPSLAPAAPLAPASVSPPPPMPSLPASVGLAQSVLSADPFTDNAPPARLASPFNPDYVSKTFPRASAGPFVQDAVMPDADVPLIAPQPRRSLRGVLKAPPSNELLTAWRALPRGPSPL